MSETFTDTSDAVRLWEQWPALTIEERVAQFKQLPSHQADEFFLSLEPREQATLLLTLPRGEQRLWLRVLPPDDAADLIQEAPVEERERLFELLDETTRSAPLVATLVDFTGLVLYFTIASVLLRGALL